MSRFIGDVPEPPLTFIQWKGTDVCLDFTCECGWGGHFDGYFAYVIKCAGCGRLWEMPCYLAPRLSQRDPEYGGVVEPKADPDESETR